MRRKKTTRLPVLAKVKLIQMVHACKSQHSKDNTISQSRASKSHKKVHPFLRPFVTITARTAKRNKQNLAANIFSVILRDFLFLRKRRTNNPKKTGSPYSQQPLSSYQTSHSSPVTPFSFLHRKTKDVMRPDRYGQ